MTVNVGTVYHIKKEYFDLTMGCGVKSYSPNGHTFPAYCCFKDKETSLYWLIPMSKNIEKYKAVYDKEMSKYNHCYSIVFGEYDKHLVAFQVQSMFPVLKKHVLYRHTRNRKAILVEHNLREEIKYCFDKMRELDEKGIEGVMHDNRRIERLLMPTN
jgi:hypothetical protein